MSGSTVCWHCGGKLVGKNGQPKPPLLYAEITTVLGQLVRVHKRCVKDANVKPMTAQCYGDYQR